MAEFSLAHIGINAENEADALKIAELFAALFGFEVKPGNSSVFAGTAVEVMKTPYLGANGQVFPAESWFCIKAEIFSSLKHILIVLKHSEIFITKTCENCEKSTAPFSLIGEKIESELLEII